MFCGIVEKNEVLKNKESGGTSPQKPCHCCLPAYWDMPFDKLRTNGFPRPPIMVRLSNHKLRTGCRESSKVALVGSWWIGREVRRLKKKKEQG